MSIPQTGGDPLEHEDQLTAFFAEGCKPREKWRIGTEHEKFGFQQDSRKPLPYDGPCSIRAMLVGLSDVFDWKPIEESGNLIGLQKGGANISLEPGGQLELSGAPLETVHETCDEVNQHLHEVRTIADRIGAGFIGIGAAPTWTHDEMPVMPKARYRLMSDYMTRVGKHGRDMMFRTCSVQVNLDYSSESDMVKKLRVAFALQPVATAFFANSPFYEGRPASELSIRSSFWRDLDADRTGILPFVFEEGFGFEAWKDYALDVPMYFVHRDGVFIDARGQSFRNFMEGRLPALPGEIPLVSDWADHLTTIFPEARIKRFIEMRGADGGPWRSLCALPAFWVGLMYSQSSLDAAWDLVRHWDAATCEGLRVSAAHEGLKGGYNRVRMIDCADKALAIAEAGLRERARSSASGSIPDECHFLDALKEILETGITPAEELLDLYRNDWKGSLNPVFEECSY